jgi:hypothetical protein
MKNILLLVSLMVTSHAIAVCSSPISRTNFSANQVLTSTRLNADLNAVYTQANELPGDCITSESVTTTQIDDGTIATVDIANNAITPAKMSTSNHSISTDCVSFATTSTSYVDITNLSVSITTSGRPVEAFLIPKDASYGNVSILGNGGVTLASGAVKLLRGAVNVGELTLSTGGSGLTDPYVVFPASTVRFFDAPVAGTYTYKLQGSVVNASYSLGCGQSRLVVREL